MSTLTLPSELHPAKMRPYSCGANDTSLTEDSWSVGVEVVSSLESPFVFAFVFEALAAFAAFFDKDGAWP